MLPPDPKIRKIGTGQKRDASVPIFGILFPGSTPLVHANQFESDSRSGG